MRKLRIGFIGAGKVGFSLGRYFTEHNQYVSGYYSRNLDSSKEAAVFTGTKYYEHLEKLIQESDTLFLTVPDGSINKVYSEILQLHEEGKADIGGRCLVHCSGAMSSMVFSGIGLKGAEGCSVHPICAVSDKLTGYLDLSKAYFTIEGRNTEDLLKLIADCGNPVELLEADKKAVYHAAAVFASNLVVAVYDAAVKLLEQCGLSEEFAAHALQPLFAGNAESILKRGTVQALTGAVERGDEETIRKHLQSLAGEEREIYRLLSLQLVQVASQKNPERNYENVKQLLEDA